MSDFEKVKKSLEEIEDIHFKQHFYDKTQDRPISEELVRNYIKKTDRLLKVEKQASKREHEQKYKIWLKMSSRYSLIIIAAIAEKDLYIITAWNSDRKWQK